jgi:hypothetical protein
MIELTDKNIAEIARRIGPIKCVKCDARVQYFLNRDPIGGARLTFFCHGAWEELEIPMRANDLKWWPRVAFAPPWKGYERYPAVPPRPPRPCRCRALR